MTQEEKLAARDRILETALALFARKGFAAVGVREIAAKAQVNLSMISYYFNGKTGILVTLMETFMDQTYALLDRAINRDLPPEREKLRALIGDLIDYVRDNFALTEMAFHAIPLDIPEITERKADHVRRILTIYGKLAHGLGLGPDDIPLFTSVGPGMISIILTHFRLKDVQAQIFGLKFDGAFYARYKEIITTLMLDGLHGLALQPHANTESL